jgi:hypothetical protein
VRVRLYHCPCWLVDTLLYKWSWSLLLLLWRSEGEEEANDEEEEEEEAVRYTLCTLPVERSGCDK